MCSRSTFSQPRFRIRGRVPGLQWRTVQFNFCTNFQGCRGYGDPRGDPHGYRYGVGMGDDLPSPQTRGDSRGIFNQPEITR